MQRGNQPCRTEERVRESRYKRASAGGRLRCERANALVIIENCISNRIRTDGHPIIPKKTSVTGSHQRPVRLQGVGLFSCAALLVQERMCQVASTAQEALSRARGIWHGFYN